jgi:hypothetical protein
MLIMLRFQETALDTCKIRDKYYEILREMRKRMLLKNVNYLQEYDKNTC